MFTAFSGRFKIKRQNELSQHNWHKLTPWDDDLDLGNISFKKKTDQRLNCVPVTAKAGKC